MATNTAKNTDRYQNAWVLEKCKFHPGLHERWTYVHTDDFLRTRISWMHR